MSLRPRSNLLWLLFAAAMLYTANAQKLPLPALDDCFYARKAVEMARAGNVFTVTWHGSPTFQNPPLQIFLMAKSIDVLGENDLAARLPSILMALGILAGTYLIGRRTVGPPAALGAAALLLVSPYFANNARRAMMEIPLTFWLVMATVLLLEGLERPRLHLALAIPLAGGILTKSVLGLLPIVVFLVAALTVPSLRVTLRRGWFWGGIALGILLGASWSIQQGLVFGWRAFEEHYLSEILHRSTGAFDPLRALWVYPKILLQTFEPVAIPGLIGAVGLWRARRERGAAGLLAVWAVLPFLLYSLSATRTPRYVFPLFPALALCGADWLQRLWPRLVSLVATGLAPGAALLGAAVFWVAPGLLARPGAAPIKADRSLRELARSGATLPYLGSHYWDLANPMLYYQELFLEPSATVDAALESARRSPSGLLVVDSGMRSALEERARVGTVLESGRWSVVRLQR